jgi:hypothetical protein
MEKSKYDGVGMCVAPEAMKLAKELPPGLTPTEFLQRILDATRAADSPRIKTTLHQTTREVYAVRNRKHFLAIARARPPRGQGP